MTIEELAHAQAALQKLYQYGHLPAGQVFYLHTLAAQIDQTLAGYTTALNSLLAKYGFTEDGTTYHIAGEDNIEAYQAELAALNKQDVGFVFDPKRLFLCAVSIEQVDKSLPPEKRLGLSANDWLALRNIIKICEREE